MAITLLGTGGLFTRIGRLGGLLNSINKFRGEGTYTDSTAKSINLGVNDIRDQYLSNNTQILDTLYSNRDTHRTAYNAFCSFLKQLSQDTLVKMADDDVKLTSLDLTTALKELIKQMKASSDDVEKQTITIATASGGSNQGNAILVASVIGIDGVQMEYCFNETIDLEVTADSQAGGTLDQESLGVAGDASQSDVLFWDWPKGSGASSSLTAIDAAQDASGNLLTNSDMEDFSPANTLSKWVTTGTPGTNVFEDTDKYKGSKALRFRGDGATTLAVAQTFNDSSAGTASTLAPNTVYALNVFLKKSATATGILRFELVDGANAVINDDAGTANRLDKDISTLTTSYAAFNGFFRTPKKLPDTIKLRVITSTVINAGQDAFIDHLAMAEATQLYAGGPFASTFSASNKLIKADTFTITVTNTYSSEWQKLIHRFFDIRDLSLQVPSDAAPTVADSLIA